MTPGPRTIEWWYAGRPFRPGGRFVWLGGKLMLTDRAVIFQSLISFGDGKVFPLEDVEGVESFGDSPPKLRLNLKTRSPLVFVVCPDFWTTVFSKDASARDDAVSVISARLAGR